MANITLASLHLNQSNYSKKQKLCLYLKTFTINTHPSQRSRCSGYLNYNQTTPTKKLGLSVQNSTNTRHTRIPLGAVHGGDDGIAGEDGRSGVGEHGVARHGGGGVQVAGSDQRLHAIVEVQPRPHQRRSRVRQPGRVWITLRRALIAPERVQRRLDTQPALPAPPLRCGFLCRREREAARRCGLVFGVGVLDMIEKWG